MIVFEFIESEANSDRSRGWFGVTKYRSMEPQIGNKMLV